MGFLETGQTVKVLLVEIDVLSFLEWEEEDEIFYVLVESIQKYEVEFCSIDKETEYNAIKKRVQNKHQIGQFIVMLTIFFELFQLE